MALILSIETASTNCSVALHDNGQQLALKQRNEGNIHAAQLFVFIDELMRETDNKYAKLEAIAVSKGPGSYTGLRIGVSAAKGLSYSLSIPLLAVNTLMALAHEAARKPLQEKAILIPMLDARRMEVYCGVYDRFLKEQGPTCAVVVDEQSFQKELEQQCYFFGDGMQKCKSALAKNSNAFFIDDIEAHAGSIGELAFKKFERQEFEDVAYFEPFYLKEFVTQSTFHKK